MCELLLINYDKNGSTPEKDEWCYKRGMVITVQDDGWAWSATELSDSYKVLKLATVPKADVLKYLEVLRHASEVDETGELRAIGRRELKLDLTKWTAADDTTLASGLSSNAQKLAVLTNREVDIAAAKVG